MKKISSFLIIFYCIFLVSCVKSGVEKMSLKKAMNVCKTNGGLQEVHTREDGFVVFCANGSSVNQKADGVSIIVKNGNENHMK